MYRRVPSVVVVGVVLVAAGCRSPQAAREEADRVALHLIDRARTEALGSAEPFTIERPSDTLRRRLMIDQQLPAATNPVARIASGEPLPVSLVDCLQIGARNSRTYQSQKEDVFGVALTLDLKRDAFRNTYSGLISSAFSSDSTSDPTEDTVAGSVGAGLTRTFKTGLTLAGKITVDVLNLLTGDTSSSFGILADATVTIPLLRDAGREIVTEPLTQAERNVMYALLTFERFKKSYAVQVATAYLSILQAMEQVRISEANVESLRRNLDRSERLAEAGRLPETQVDQTRQDVLRARNRLVSARQTVESRLDGFNLTLGLPVDARLKLEDGELGRLSEELGSHLLDGASAALTDEANALRRAFENRLDMRVTECEVEDAERKVRVAASAFKAGVEIQLDATTRERRYSGSDSADLRFGDGTYGAGLDVDLPWELTSERNAYRQSLIALEQARRTLEAEEDGVKQDVRDGLRTLAEAREAYRIQHMAVELARRRVKSTAMFLEAGRSEIRDLLESEEALVSAQNALTDALVSFVTGRWSLLRDTGELEVDAQGLWNVARSQPKDDQ